MQLFQPCSSPEQSKAIADLSAGLGDGAGMMFCALSTGGESGTNCALSIDGGSVAYCAISTAQGAGEGCDSGTTFCAQPTTAQASAIESLCCANPIPVCELFLFGVHEYPSRDPRHDSGRVVGAILPCRHHIPIAECNSDSSGGVTSMEAKIDDRGPDSHRRLHARASCHASRRALKVAPKARPKRLNSRKRSM